MSDVIHNGQGISAYDAASQSPNRSSFVAFPNNSRRELTSGNRREIVRKSRALEANCPFLTRIVRKYARHAIGSGIHFRILSEDETFNDAARRDVEEWWNNPGTYSVDGSIDGWTAKRLAVETMIIDGEFNAAMTKSADWPMLQPLDVFEIETPNPLRGSEKPTDWDDGIRINELERPIEYAVKSLPRGNMTQDAKGYSYVPALSMIHIHRRRRIRGHRGLPWGYSGLNKGIDALDLASLCTGTAKLHSALAVTVKRTGRKGKRGAISKITDGSGGVDPTDTTALEKVYGSMINYVGENGEIDLKSSSHPTVNLMEFIKMLFAEMSLGFDVPVSVMWSLSEIGGTAVRSDMEDAQSSFDVVTDMIVWHYVRREVIWKISTAINSGRIAAPKDPYWYSKMVFRGPRKLTVDVGRMASAFKTLTRNAGMSIPRFLEEQGFDAYEEARDNNKYLKYIKELYESTNVPVEWVYEPTPGTVNQINVNPSQE
jgi:capsid protein